jgi:hypothetical protein
MNVSESTGIDQPISLTNLNQFLTVREIVTTIKQLVFAKNIYKACLIAELDTKFEYTHTQTTFI